MYSARLLVGIQFIGWMEPGSDDEFEVALRTESFRLIRVKDFGSSISPRGNPGGDDAVMSVGPALLLNLDFFIKVAVADRAHELQDPVQVVPCPPPLASIEVRRSEG